MRKACKRKVRVINSDALGWVLNGFRSVANTDPITIVRIKNHDALASAAKGHASYQDVDTLLGALNMAAALAGLGIGTEYWAEIKAASAALDSMSHRTRTVFTGTELTAMNMAIEIHDAQLDDTRTTVAVMETALDVVKRVLKEKKRMAKKQKETA
jgi:hypothetical protein